MKKHTLSVRLISAVVGLIATILAVAGCGGGGAGASISGGGSPAAGTTGTLAIHLADAPAPGVTAVNVTIPKVDANINGQWQTIATPNMTVNLLDLAAHDAMLAQAPLPAGAYTQIRFFVSAATVVDANGTHDVKIPSAVQSGIKVNVDYTIQANTITDILLDFNVAKSLHVTGDGKYMLQPVIPAVVKTLSGTVSGNVTSAGNPAPGATVTATYVSGTNYPIGTAVNTATTLADGSFKIWALLPGTYDVSVSYNDPVSSTVQTGIAPGAVVTAGQDTNVGTIAVTTPITPGSVSGTVLNTSAVAVGGATVTATYTSGGNYPNGTVVGTATSAVDGTFSITNLLPGTYTISFSYTDPVTLAVESASMSAGVASGTDTPLGSVTLA